MVIVVHAPPSFLPSHSKSSRSSFTNSFKYGGKCGTFGHPSDRAVMERWVSSRTPLSWGFWKNNPTQRKFWKYLIGLQSYSKPSLSQFVPLDKRMYFTEGSQKFLNLCMCQLQSLDGANQSPGWEGFWSQFRTQYEGVLWDGSRSAGAAAGDRSWR